MRELRYFVAVAEEEHVGRAAARLRISASPLSRQVRALEARVGLPLLEHSGRRVRLTAAGRRFLDAARDVLAAGDQLAEHIRDQLGDLPTACSVGATDTAVHAGILARGLAAVTAPHPGLRVAFALARSPDLLDRLRRRDLDVALVNTPPPGDDPFLTSRQVLDDPVVLLAPAGHPAAQAAELSPDLLDGVPWIVSSRDSAAASYRRFLAAATQAGFTPEIRYEASDVSIRVALVGAGLGCSLVHASAMAVLADHEAIVTRPLPWLPLRVAVHVAHPRRPSTVARHFAGALPGT